MSTFSTFTKHSPREISPLRRPRSATTKTTSRLEVGQADTRRESQSRKRDQDCLLLLVWVCISFGPLLASKVGPCWEKKTSVMRRYFGLQARLLSRYPIVSLFVLSFVCLVSLYQSHPFPKPSQITILSPMSMPMSIEVKPAGRDQHQRKPFPDWNWNKSRRTRALLISQF